MFTANPPVAEKLDPAICYRALTTRDARFDGRFFTAVRTTGIYCRPICPAQTPKEQNCTFYPSAAAAEVAGFRSCLRCRPERAPNTAPANPLVERAMALIALGYATDGPRLSRKLGVSERHLRRLFAEHLGASPKQVAETRRHLLARQLVMETDLPLTDVALASGFGSLRRFNHVFQDLYGQPPSQMRRRLAKPQADRSFALSLPYRAPYDWDGVITALAAHAIPGVEAVTPQSYARLITLGGHHGTVVVSPGTGDSLTARIDFPKLAYLPEIVARLRALFDLAADTGLIDAHLATDAALAPWVAARPGMRVPGAWDAFECAVRVILGQQVSVAAGRRLAAEVVTRYGTAIETGIPGLTGLFPSPERLVAVADHLSLDLNMPRARAAAIINLARAEAENPDLLAPGGDLDQTIGRLTAVAGIGPWTAHCIALFALREPDAFPAQDVGMQRVLGGLSAKALEARSESWRPWRAYAAIHLWLQALNTVPPAKTGKEKKDALVD
ncbi:DNA-3-methyladenine glycosylase 2 [Acidisoma silvae]|uniref:DNA-3-methyladenine glycosylase II n=1 Tax=Acidisoma silvae TaxID=2802396 RepID=A0A964DWX4_9PROT|nr:DNA-3-methyladenine glycosylase 2 [Acidisoma silvae]MCB8873660.1 DNA-3-methyladenine glycosylase 2 family protein [Acidisoma silvae]